jgi:hypothetical protein
MRQGISGTVMTTLMDHTDLQFKILRLPKTLNRLPLRTPLRTPLPLASVDILKSNPMYNLMKNPKTMIMQHQINMLQMSQKVPNTMNLLKIAMRGREVI